MFKNAKIGMRLTLSFGLVLFLLIVIILTGVSALSNLNNGMDIIVNDRYPKIVQVNNILTHLNRIARSMRNTLLMDKADDVKKELSRINESRSEIKGSLDSLNESIKSEKGRAILKSLEDARGKYVPIQEKFLQLLEDNKKDSAKELLLGELRPQQLAYFDALNKLIAFQNELMQQGGKEASKEYASSRNLMLLLGAISVVFALVAAFMVTRSITRQIGGEPDYATDIVRKMAAGDLTVQVEVKSGDTSSLLAAMQTMVNSLTQVVTEVRTASDSLSSASEEVSATAQSMSQATSEQAASVEETSASIEQMSASINQNTENAKVTDGMASSAAKQAVEGGEAVSQTVAAMKQIAGKIGIIDDIAYQTNLLALNAAIEAARAGEHGKGFAVVAAEVRKLAERSQIASQEIGELASNSVGRAEKAGKLLDEMVPSINKTSDLVQEITAASEEQSSGVGQINNAMSQLSQITQQNASASEELAATAEEMSGQAEQLQQTMSFFKVDSSAATVKQKRSSGVVSGRKAVPHTTNKLTPVRATVRAVSEDEFVKF
jgi:methyl-accepting chemotaxis protein